MVVPSTTSARQETATMLLPPPCPGGGAIPTVDMSAPRGRGALSRQVARACTEQGFFRAVNHGVPPAGPAARLDAATSAFFALAAHDKQRAGPPSPLGYGCRSIGFNGDVGELEYLLLHANPAAVAHRASSIDTNDPSRFSSVVNEYVEAVKQLACDILDLLGEGLGLEDPRLFSKLITETDSDSLLRINHYPPSCTVHKLDHDDQCKLKGVARTKAGSGGNPAAGGRIGFGEHSDPQLLSLLRANDIDGLQVLLPDINGKDTWIQVPADSSAYFVNVGDLLQALTNGRLVSVRHRVIASACRPRLSTIYFAAPPLHARISALPEMVTADSPPRYRSFTWAEYKTAMYSLRLSHSRLELFHVDDDESGNGSKGK
ncbi:gibberellin 2-beta-dioxygenase 1 [Triticum urartu]|uniref:gibberellin 2beta-dioxygenase n=1 Tax=Triticum urartu TaxID=4572 RepID=A0A8R7NYB2_TRIUA|nr:gibberellin 2-beta-dioxygenase 1 [Triticum urartu]